MTTSESLDKLLPALVAARAKFAPFVKAETAKAGTYSYRYGDLAALFDATMPSLLANGLMLTQATDITADGHFVLVSRLMHQSGQWLESRFPLRTYDRTQETGSLITYARRYSAQALLGVAAEADDDGAAAHHQDAPGRKEGEVWLVPACIDLVTKAPTQKPGVDRYTVTLSTGEKVTTISAKLGAALMAAQEDTREYMVELKQTQWGTDVKSIKPIDAPSPAAPLAAPSTEQPF